MPSSRERMGYFSEGSTRLTVGGPGGLDHEYRFSDTQNNGRITQRKDWVSGEEVTYQYDSLNRLISAATTGPEWGQSFGYDGFGNLLSQTVTKGSAPMLSISVDASTNRITTSGYSYDANGNMTAMPFVTMSYDVENRLAQATHSSNGTDNYVYDPSNRRVWKQEPLCQGCQPAERISFYGVDGTLMQAGTGPGAYDSNYTNINVYFAGRLVWREYSNGMWGGVAVDRLGSAVGDNWSSHSYFPFGEEKVTTSQNLVKFATYYRDATTALDYANQRYYGRTMGRFLTPDPYRASGGPGDPQSWNRYAYVQNDPINFLDPAGLDECPAGACFTVTVTGYAYVDLSYFNYIGLGLSIYDITGRPAEQRRNRAGPPPAPPRPECDRSDAGNAQKLDWIAAHRQDAAKVARELGITSADVLGLSALESFWGTSRFATEGHNFFGLQYPAPLAIGVMLARNNPKVRVATFASYGDSAESFARSYGSFVQGIWDPVAFASALQNARKFGINPDGSKVPTFVSDVAATIKGLASRLDCEKE